MESKDFKAYLLFPTIVGLVVTVLAKIAEPLYAPTVAPIIVENKIILPSPTTNNNSSTPQTTTYKQNNTTSNVDK